MRTAWEKSGVKTTVNFCLPEGKVFIALNKVSGFFSVIHSAQEHSLQTVAVLSVVLFL